MKKRDPNLGGEWPRIPPREGLEGVPDGYERIAWRGRLLAAALTLGAVGIMLLLLWAIERWVGGGW